MVLEQGPVCAPSEVTVAMLFHMSRFGVTATEGRLRAEPWNPTSVRVEDSKGHDPSKQHQGPEPQLRFMLTGFA